MNTNMRINGRFHVVTSSILHGLRSCFLLAFLWYFSLYIWLKSERQKISWRENDCLLKLVRTFDKQTKHMNFCSSKKKSETLLNVIRGKMLVAFLQLKKKKSSKSERVLTIFAAFFHLNRTVKPDYWMLQKSHKYLKKTLTLDHNRSTVVFFRLENTSIENTISEERK